MSGLAELFTGANFQNTVQRYCAQQQWRISGIDSSRAVLRFQMDSGRTQTLYVSKFDTTLEFSVPSNLAFDSPDDVPHYLSTLLLKRSCEKKIGFWCIEEIRGKQVYSCMHNAEMLLIDSAYFASVVRVLIDECDEFEDVVERMLR